MHLMQVYKCVHCSVLACACEVDVEVSRQSFQSVLTSKEVSFIKKSEKTEKF